MKKGLVLVWLLLLFAAVGALFWYNDWVYQLPTPIPRDYKTVANGKFIFLNRELTNDQQKPVFLHFFNPDCPCSRFNIKQFKTLVRQYGKHIDFRVVVISNKKFTAAAIQDKFGLDIPVSFDGAIADSCGVYSTPQAVLLNASHHLYYRGNYNISRYCTDEKTNYAKIAIEGLTQGQDRITFSALALRAYGCSLPGCDK